MHAVARLRASRIARSEKAFRARGSRLQRCDDCRLAVSLCMCRWRPSLPTTSGMCLIMHDVEALKPTNTGWLVADVVSDTYAFGWSRTAVDEALLELLAQPQWQPYLVFPGEYAEPQRVVSEPHSDLSAQGKRPLFILLDATWTEARKMFRKSPYLDALPVLGLSPAQLSRYRLRRSKRDDHLCTAEVAACCLALAGETRAAEALDCYLDVFSIRYLAAKQPRPIDPHDELHQRLAGYCRASTP